MSMIYYRLKELDKIDLGGQEPDLYLSWFFLTDGYLWLRFGDQTLFEYSKKAISFFEDNSKPYCDYYIVRFLEDFTELFDTISVSIPDKIYSLTENLEQFKLDALKWLEIYDKEDEENSNSYFEEYIKLISWTSERRLHSSHLIGGPKLYFFRNDDKIRVIWETDHTLENGICLWKAKNGSIEMNYSDFIKEIKLFGNNFYAAMEKQIDLTLAKEWGDIKVDKARLVEEHKERKLMFDKKLSSLENKSKDQTNWIEIEELYKRVLNEIAK